MKKYLSAVIIIVFAVLSFCSGCKEKEAVKMGKNVPAKSSGILIVYFSHSGNTRAMAKQIQKAVGGDIFEIIPVNPYPTEYQAVADQAKKEINSGFKPALKSKVENISKYDIIFVGSPNWWSTIAPPVTTFLTSYDLAEKTVIPFVTHGGGGMAHCETDIQKLCSKSTFRKGLAVNGRSVNKAQDKVDAWLREIKVTR